MQRITQAYSTTAHRLQPGLILQEERLFSIAEVRQFLLLTGDTNPFHTCESAARAQGFEGPVLPGLLCASLFPALIARHFPGAIYAKQHLNFQQPALASCSVKACVQITAIARAKVTFATTCFGSSGEECITGEAVAVIK